MPNHIEEHISVGNYLLSRLAQLGVESMFGVPGDFNLGFLDLVEDHPTIGWIGCCNELNASYAADGYARVKEHSIGVVATTFGVGELSAVNGIAGAFSEMVPVLHVVGAPSTKLQKSKALLHHTLGDGRYDVYSKIAAHLTVAQGLIMDTGNAAAEIDRVLTECLTVARPVYLTLPTDMVFERISSASLSRPLNRHPSPNDPPTEAFVLDEIMKLVEEAWERTIILVDACTIRHDAREEVSEFIKKSGFPVYAAPMGKTAVSEEYERYGGIYVGSVSQPDVKEKVEAAKLIISVGALRTDINTGGFTDNIATASSIELHSQSTKILYASFDGIGMKELLPKLTARLEPHHASVSEIPVPRFVSIVPDAESEGITHAYFWPRMGQFFREKDIVVAEIGTSSFGIMDIPLPRNAIFLTQVLWSSIGWSLGSTLGAALAAREKDLGRVILFIGDGSLQLTVQEISTMIRNELKPIIFLINNQGYTVERYLHGENRLYNDIQNWSWTGLLNVLGDNSGELSKSYTVNTPDELSSLLDKKEFANTEKIQLVEVIMDKFDAPRSLRAQAALCVKSNAYAEVE